MKKKLPKSARLNEKEQFKRLFEDPNVYKNRFFFAYWKTNSKKQSRIGITIKGRPSSILRTHVKRVVREWFRVSRENFPSLDINIVLKVDSKTTKEFCLKLKKSLEEWKLG